MATRDYSGKSSKNVRPDFDGGVSKSPAKRVSNAKKNRGSDIDDVPTIDKPPKAPVFDLDDESTPPFERGTERYEQLREQLTRAPTTQPHLSTGLIPLTPVVHGDMSEGQRENQEKGARGALVSYDQFEKDLPNIYELLQSASSDGAITAIHKSLLVSMLELMPQAIKKYHDSPMDFNAYALAAMITQLRNLISDLQASKDRSIISERVNKVLIKGAFVMMVQHAAELNGILKANLSDKIRPEYAKNVSLALDDNLRTLSRYMGQTYEELSENVGKLLTE